LVFTIIAYAAAPNSRCDVSNQRNVRGSGRPARRPCKSHVQVCLHSGLVARHNRSFFRASDPLPNLRFDFEFASLFSSILSPLPTHQRSTMLRSLTRAARPAAIALARSSPVVGPSSLSAHRPDRLSSGIPPVLSSPFPPSFPTAAWSLPLFFKQTRDSCAPGIISLPSSRLQPPFLPLPYEGASFLLALISSIVPPFHFED